MENLLSLMEMGFELSQVRSAYEAGCQTPEEAIHFLMDVSHPTRQTSPNRLVLNQTHLPQQSIFSSSSNTYIPPTTPVYPSGSQQSDMEVDGDSNSGSSEVKSRCTLPQEAIDFQKSQMSKQAELIRQEKLSRAAEKERLRAQIADDRNAHREKQKLFLTETLPMHPEPTNSQASNQPEPSPSSDSIRIRIYLNGMSSPITSLNLSPSIKYEEFLQTLQTTIMTSHRTAFLSSADQMDNADVCQHLTLVQVTDPCIQLLVMSWPRRILPRPVDNSATGSVPVQHQSIHELGITNGVGVNIRHAQDGCPLASSRPRTPPSLELPLPTSSVPSYIFPQGGQQLVPQPPSGSISSTHFDQRETIRRAALRLDSDGRRSPLSDPHIADQTLRVVPTMSHLCVDQLVSMLKQCSANLTDSRRGVDPSQLEYTGFGSVFHAVHQLANFPLPPSIGEQLIGRLCREVVFDSAMAPILRNCVTRLDLSSYRLASNDLIQCLVDKWPHLTELRLDFLQSGQVTIETVGRLRSLENLRVLSLNGLKAVCDANIILLVDLPNLGILHVSQTNVTDSGWVSVSVRAMQAARPLFDLECAGMGDRLTSRGLDAICVAFPNLGRLNVAMNSLTTSPTESKSQPLRFLTHVNVSGCRMLEHFPDQLIPPLDVSTGAVVGTGLIELRVAGCVQLDVGQLIDRLKGQPLQQLIGIDTLNHLDAALLKSFCDGRFPLTELALRSINWMIGSAGFLSHLLRDLQPTTLTHLSLPQRSVESSDECELVDALRQIKRFTNLRELDLGGQLESNAEYDVLVELLDVLSLLRAVTVFKLQRSLEQSVRELCANRNCAVHIQNLTE